MRKPTSQLVWSDVAAQDIEEVAKDPYAILAVPAHASLNEIKQAYRRRARMYHQDMIKPNREFLHRLYTPEDIISLSDKEVPNLETLLADLKDPSPKDRDKQRRAYENIRQMAHRRMIRLNLAYEMLNERYQKGSSPLLGYEAVEEKHRFFGSVKAINLECKNARLVYLDDLADYWVKGAHLEFEWGTPQAPWEGPYYDESTYVFCVPLKHLFAHLELLQGRAVSRTLLSSLRDVFHLNDDTLQYVQEMISSKKTLEGINRALRTMDFGEYYQGLSYRQKETFERQLLGQVERIILGRDLEMGYFSVDLIYDNDRNTIGIKLQKDTYINEEDYLLLSTIAYGPSLEKRPQRFLTGRVE